MMAWLVDYSPLISAGASLLMLVVWAIYLHLFWQSYRRQHQANIIISRGAGTGLDSLCLIGNMSAEPIFVEGIIIFAECQGERWARAITTFSDIGTGASSGLRSREGPLKSGEYFTLATFRQLLEIAGRPAGSAETCGTPDLDAIEIWIVSDFSSENDLVYARRKFLIRSVGRQTIFRPTEFETKLITRAPERHEVERILQEHLEEAVTVTNREAAREMES